MDPAPFSSYQRIAGARDRLCALGTDGLAADLCEHLAIAADELLGNAIEHGSRFNPEGKIEFSLVRTPRVLLFKIGDAGPGFSLNAIAHAAVSNPPEEPLRHTQFRNEMGMRPGGFWHSARQTDCR